VEPAVGRRGRRRVPEQVIAARVAHDLLHAGGEIVAVDDGAAVGIVGEDAQRVERRGQVVAIGLQADALVDVVLERRQAARVDRIDRRVVPVDDVERLLDPAEQVGRVEELLRFEARVRRILAGLDPAAR
jgi:hypothetical protein